MKSMSQLQTVSDIKGMHSIGARSIPKAMRSSYLELYVLDRERSRLEKERFSLDKRRNSAQTRLDSIAQRMDRLKKEIEEETDAVAQHSVPSKKHLKTMSIKY
jgi:chromosome segregation ATPase